MLITVLSRNETVPSGTLCTVREYKDLTLSYKHKNKQKQRDRRNKRNEPNQRDKHKGKPQCRLPRITAALLWCDNIRITLIIELARGDWIWMKLRHLLVLALRCLPLGIVCWKRAADEVAHAVPLHWRIRQHRTSLPRPQIQAVRSHAEPIENFGGSINVAIHHLTMASWVSAAAQSVGLMRIGKAAAPAERGRTPLVRPNDGHALSQELPQADDWALLLKAGEPVELSMSTTRSKAHDRVLPHGAHEPFHLFVPETGGGAASLEACPGAAPARRWGRGHLLIAVVVGSRGGRIFIHGNDEDPCCCDCGGSVVAMCESICWVSVKPC